MAGSYKDLVAWQKGVLLALDVYRASRAFPRDELYGLTSQLRRRCPCPARLQKDKRGIHGKSFNIS